MPTRDLSMLNSIANPQTTQGVSPQAYQQFNTSILGLLQKSQQLGTAGFQKQGLDAQAAQAGRISAQTPQSLIGAAPGVQSAARSASAMAMNPTIEGAARSGATFSEQLGNFGNILNFARSIGSEYQQAQERAQDRAFQQIMSQIDSFGGEAFKGLDDKELSQLEKTAGLPTGFLKRASSLKTLSQQQLAQNQTISPYQQASLDLQKDELSQNQRQFEAESGYTYDGKSLKEIPKKLKGGPYIESGSGRQVDNSDQIDPNKSYHEMTTGRVVKGSELLSSVSSSSLTVSAGGQEFEVLEM